jgi:hypothetical protein
MTVVQVGGGAEQAPILMEIAGFDEARVNALYNVETRVVLDKAVPVAARKLYAEAIELACSCAVQTKERLAALPATARPDEFEVQFALNVDGKVGAKIVELGSAAQVQVRMLWNRGDDV